MSEPLLQARDLSLALASRTILSGVSLSLMPGEMLALVGPNGAGKTTMLRALAGLVSSQSGDVRLMGRDIGGWSRSERARRIAYLPQGGTITWPLKASDMVALGRMPHGAALHRLRTDDLRAIGRAVSATGIEDFLDRPATQLSGGERGRVLLARALAVEAPILLVDEPVSALDPKHQLAIMDTLRREAREGRGVIAVMHDLGLAARYADRMVVLEEGRIVADGAPGEVLAEMGVAAAFGVTIGTEHRDDGLHVVIRKAGSV